MSRRMDRMASEGGDIMAAVFGAGDESESVHGFAVFPDGRMVLEDFMSTDDGAEHYARATLSDGDEWLDGFTEAREAGRPFVDPVFPPNSASLGAVQACASDVPWRRVSEMFSHSRYITLKFVDSDEPRLGDHSGRCFAIDMNPALTPSNSGQSDETHSHYGDLAKAIVADAIAERDLTPRLWAEGVGPVTANLKAKIESHYVRFARIGNASVRFFRFEALGTPRIAVCVELVYEQPLKMFDRPEPDASGVVAQLVEPSDINQGVLGDCYFLCALSILAAHPRLLFDVLPDVPPSMKLGPAEGGAEGDPDDEQEANPEGCYAVRFWRDNEWRIVVVDDYVPVEPTTHGFLFASPCPRTAEVWCIICEKCYAKLNGSYGAIEGGNDEMAIEDLCGGVPFSHEMGPSRSTSTSTGGKYSGGAEAMDRLWCDVIRYGKESAMLGCSWFAHGGADDAHIKRGVFANHAYGVLGTAEVSVAGRKSAARLIKLRNPHGRGGEFNGEWADGDAAWSSVDAAECARVGYVDADDGTFFMSLADWFALFEQLCICRPLMPTPYLSSNWSVWCINGEFHGDAGGAGFAAGPAGNYQFQINIDAGVELVCTISVTSRRISKRKYPGLLLAVAKGCVPGQRTRALDAATMVGGESPIHAAQNRSASVEHKLQAVDGPFNLIPMTTEPWTGRYYLRIFSSGPAQVEPLGQLQ